MPVLIGKDKTQSLSDNDSSVSDIINEAFDNIELTTIGKLCLDARISKSLTQEQASALLKVRVKIIKDFENGFNDKIQINRDRKSFYWPRLNTDLDGFIMWNWTAKQIVDFCNAFDEPFAGASSYVKKSRVRLKNVETDDSDIYFHPYQYGLLYRKNENSIWIACKDGGIKVNNVITEENVVLKLGDRFTTFIS